MLEVQTQTLDTESEEIKTADARPLEDLVGLIKQDLAAGEEHYRAAGEKLIEAKEQLRGQFMKWVKQHFTISHRQATNYIALAKAHRIGIQIPLSKINNPRREQKKRSGPKKMGPRPNINLDNAAAEQDESSQRRELALKIIDAGFNALANKTQPDKGEPKSKEDEARMNEETVRLLAARDWLEQYARGA